MFRRTLSKSKILAFRQCAKRLWLEVHRPELREDSLQTLATFQFGHQVGTVARQIYAGAHGADLIDVESEGYSRAFERTLELVLTGQRPIFEAGFSIPGALAFADVLVPIHHKGRTHWRMIEVKSSASVKDYHRDDLAFQTYLAREAGVSIESVAVAHVDTSWVYPGNGRYEGLLHEVDLTEEVTARNAEAESWLRLAHETVELREPPVVDVGPQCESPYPCGFCNYCHRDIPEVHDPLAVLPKLTAKRREEIESLPIHSLADVPAEMLTPIQQRVQECTTRNETFFDSAAAASELARYPLPVGFLDFETTSMAVPIWEGTRPYQQIPFQFSIHTVSDDSGARPSGFLDLSGEDPSRPLAEKLVTVCAELNTVFAYNAPFETRVIRELARRFPDLAVDLTRIADCVVDLLPIARAHYYHPIQGGSWSLKAILPAICPDLSYDELDGVQNGGDAAAAYFEAVAPETSPSRKQEIREQLKTYCTLDTLALFRIWQYFSGRFTPSERGD